MKHPGSGDSEAKSMQDRVRRLEMELQEVRKSLSQLQQELAELRRSDELRRHPVEIFLQQRGFPTLFHGASPQLLLPPAASAAQKARFYTLMRRYSFRLFLRDLIQFPAGRDLSALSRYCSARTARSYLGDLSDMGVAENGADGSYRLRSGQVSSFGPTLEWYVCEIFRREFLSPALFNVRLDGTRYGGDYDVLAVLNDFLVYVEVKSSPPRGVELPAVTAFLNRLEDLEPHLAIFLVDTELRMKDKIVSLFEEAGDREGTGRQSIRAQRLVDEIFHIRHAIYLINSRKGIYSNIRLCIRDFLHNGETAGVSCGRGE